jgi:hypothetical protein
MQYAPDVFGKNASESASSTDPPPPAQAAPAAPADALALAPAVAIAVGFAGAESATLTGSVVAVAWVPLPGAPLSQASTKRVIAAAEYGDVFMPSVY